MKGFDKKGVSPVVATILLIALTVAAVGIVAVILTNVGGVTPAPAIMFGTPDAYVGPDSGGSDNSAVIDLPITSGSTSMMDLKVYYTCYVENYLGSNANVTVTYVATFGNDSDKSVASVSPPAPAEGVPSADVNGVYVRYWGSPVRSAGDKISFFFNSDNTTDTTQLLPSAVGGAVTVKLIHTPSNTTIYEGTIITKAKVW
ncbi:MAG TPA: type IV pilin [Hadesarchaea archaeon]|nr:type IV pilin [Hadesarchaea archaeon]